MANTMHNGTAEGMLRFLTWARDKGLMNPKTAEAYRSASKIMLGIDENWETMKIAELDADVQLDRFTRLHGTEYSPQSLATYGRRLRASIELYENYLTDPTGFRGHSRPQRSAAKKAAEQRDVTRKASTPRRSDAAAPPERAEPTLITYPFPLTSGGLAYLQLPRQLSRDDARRLASFLESLALDPDAPPAPNDRAG